MKKYNITYKIKKNLEIITLHLKNIKNYKA